MLLVDSFRLIYINFNFWSYWKNWIILAINWIW